MNRTTMKKNIFSAIMAMLMLVSSLAFVACGEDQLDTNQFTKPVSLLAFGPSPVARGGELRVIGTGLNQVTSVTLPGSGEVTDITRVSDEEIRITVPQDAQPGKIAIKTASQSIESTTVISYTEPVGFAETNPLTPTMLRPGQELIIKGEYLNLVQSVIFPEGVVVPVEKPSRSEIRVIVPDQAQTGKIAISFCATGDTIPNEIYCKEVLEIILPSVDEVANLTGKKPGDEITQKGADLNLVDKLTVAGKEVKFSIANSAITYKLPEDTPAEAIVSMYPASGVEVVIATIGMQLPTNVKVAPNADVWAGSKLTITGKDLDVVSGVIFPGVADAVKPSAQSATSLTVTVPGGAQSGKLALTLKSGISIETEEVKTIKPVFESYSANPVPANSELTIKGKNLNNVVSVQFQGVSVAVTPTATAITLQVPTIAESGVVTLVLSNNETVELKELKVAKPNGTYIVDESVLITSDEHEIKAGDVIAIEVENIDKLAGVKVNGEDCQIIVKGKTLYVGTPESADMKSTLTVVSIDGTSIDYTLSAIPNTEQKQVIWSGMTEITWNDGGRVFVPWSALENVPEGAELVLCYTQKDQTWSQAQINNGWWQKITNLVNPDGTKITNGEGALVPTDLYGWFSDGELNRETAITLTPELLAELKAHTGDDGSCTVIQGSDLIFTKVYVRWTISLEETIWQGNENLNWKTPIIFDKDVVAGWKAGQILRLTCECIEADYHMFRLISSWWTFNKDGDPETNVNFSESGVYEIKLIQPLLDQCLIEGMAITGFGCNVTKVTIE